MGPKQVRANRPMTKIPMSTARMRTTGLVFCDGVMFSVVDFGLERFHDLANHLMVPPLLGALGL
jgi:hypothetical protein